MKLLPKSAKGFTLIELLLAITVGGIILGVVGTFFMNAYVSALKEGRKTQLNSSAKAALDQIVQDIRSKDNVCIYTDDGTTLTVIPEISASIGVQGSAISWGPNPPVWYRLNTIAAGSKRLLKFQNVDGSLTLVDQNTSAVCVDINSFTVSIISTASNVTLYNIKLELTAGTGPNQVETTVETQCTKYKAP